MVPWGFKVFRSFRVIVTAAEKKTQGEMVFYHSFSTMFFRRVSLLIHINISFPFFGISHVFTLNQNIDARDIQYI
jgi:hypothetical protein